MMVGIMGFFGTLGEKATQDDFTGTGALAAGTGGLQGSKGRLGCGPYNSKSSSNPDSTLEVLPLDGVTLSLPKLWTLRASLLDRVVDVGELGGEDQSMRLVTGSWMGRDWDRGNNPDTSCDPLGSFGRGCVNLGGGGLGGGFFFGRLLFRFTCLSLWPNMEDDQELLLVGGGGAARVGTFISPENNARVKNRNSELWSKRAQQYF